LPRNEANGYVNKTAEERSECLAAGAGSKSEPKRG
jgi:hypothetical protein